MRAMGLMEPFVTDASVRRAADQGVSGGHSITVTFVATGAWLSWLEQEAKEAAKVLEPAPQG